MRPRNRAKFKNLFFHILAFLFFVLILFLENGLFPKGQILLKLNVLGRSSVVIVLPAALIFLLLAKEKLGQLEKWRLSAKALLAFLPLHLFFLGGFYFFKVYLISRPKLADDYLTFLIFIRYLLPILIVLTLFCAVYSLKFLKRFYRELFIAGGLGVLAYEVAVIFKKLWPIFAAFTAKSVAFLLKIFFQNVRLDFNNPASPRVGAGSFTVLITDLCSGIEGLGLFFVLSLVILFFEKKNLRFGRGIAFLLLGLFGVLIVNVIRIFSLLLVGIYYNKEFALHTFHTNAGWILFVLYFLIFWAVFQPLILRKRSTK